MVDEGELATFVGRWARLEASRPAGGTASSPGATPWIDAAVVASTSHGLRLETSDRRALELDERGIAIEFGSDDSLRRLHGTARLLVADPPPIVLAFAPYGTAEILQRREWVRVRAAVPVEMKPKDSPKATVSTSTLDISGGGAKLSDARPFRRGDAVAMAITLPDGPVDVTARVLDINTDGNARVRFEGLSEGDSKRIVRFVFNVQRDVGRSGAGAEVGGSGAASTGAGGAAAAAGEESATAT